ncbi:MAG: hypothetical protein ACTSRK_08210 [Promethearchaeota archaeon]
MNEELMFEEQKVNTHKNDTLRLKQLWKISKYSYREVFLDSQMNMAGSQSSRVLEQMEKNQHYMTMQEIAMKVVLVIYVAGMIFLPIQAFKKIDVAIGNGVSMDWVLCAGTLILGLFFLSEMLLIVTFGLFFAAGLLSGKFLEWYVTLPFSKEDIRIISLFSFFRGLDAQIMTLFFVLPIGIAIATQSLVLTLLSFVFSFGNVVLCFGVLVLLGERVHRVLDENRPVTRRNDITRVSILASYVIVLIGGIIGIEMAFLYVDPLFNAIPANLELVSTLNYLWALIPFPFNNSYILVYFYLVNPTNSILNISLMLIGSALLILMIVLIYRRTKNLLTNLLWNTQKTSEGAKKLGSLRESTTIEDVGVKSTSPTKAFFIKDRNMATRDMQMIMLMIMPIILPLMSLFMMAFIPESEGMGDSDMLFMNFTMNFSYLLMSAVMIVWGLVSVETTGASILGALPVQIRDQANSKLIWLFLILLASSLIQGLVFLGKPVFWDNLLLTTLCLPFGFIMGVFTLEMKARLFGKMKYKYVLDDVHIKNKAWKWFLIIVVVTLVYIILLVLIGYLTMSNLDSADSYNSSNKTLLVVMGGLDLCLGALAWVLYNRMFPR